MLATQRHSPSSLPELLKHISKDRQSLCGGRRLRGSGGKLEMSPMRLFSTGLRCIHDADVVTSVNGVDAASIFDLPCAPQNARQHSKTSRSTRERYLRRTDPGSELIHSERPCRTAKRALMRAKTCVCEAYLAFLLLDMQLVMQSVGVSISLVYFANETT